MAGAGRQPWFELAGPNLALEATVRAGKDYDSATYPLKHVNDGKWSTRDNSVRWLSAAGVPAYVEFSWEGKRQVSGYRVVSGYFSGGRAGDPITAFGLEWHDGTGWREVPGSGIAANRQVDFARKFGRIETERIRLAVRESPGDILRIWEIGFYDPAGEENDD